jgi:predicted nucleic acid-binding protein
LTRYLVDNIVLQRLPRNSAIRTAVTEILDTEDDELCSCAATLDELADSARSSAEHAEAVQRLRHSFLYLPMAAAIDQIIIDIRTALFATGHGRAAGVIDVQIAATAIHRSATVLHYDSDYDHITDACPDLSARWVVPRGSTD